MAMRIQVLGSKRRREGLSEPSQLTGSPRSSLTLARLPIDRNSSSPNTLITSQTHYRLVWICITGSNRHLMAVSSTRLIFHYHLIGQYYFITTTTVRRCALP